MDVLTTYVSKTTSSDAIMNWVGATLLPAAIILVLKIVGIFIIWFIGAKLIKLTRKIVRKMLGKGNVDKGVITFLDNFMKFALYALLILIILSIFHVDTTGIAAAVASAGVAIGLALQGSLSNLAGGVLILLLKPFKVGDYIVAGGVEGTVSEVQMFSTKLITPDNKVVIVPNATLSSGTITNVSVMDKRRLDITASIAYTADLKLAKSILMRLLEDCEYVMKEEVYDVFVGNLGASSVDLNVRFWVNSADYWAAKAYITENIKVKLDANNIEIPYNKLDVFVQQ
ncbi:MAG: mechanosensitive ion channel [Lachnospiraceae bacterium]|nr:mechanosensitive ion channel [Lachnospiraceae bacterium]MBR3808036.1 mechanosensitive ion channel [Lachnospiraceae bacterium]